MRVFAVGTLLVLGAASSVALAQPRPVHTSSTTLSVQRDDEPMVQGSGRVVRQVRPAGEFAAIEVGDSITIEVAIGGARTIEVEADDNLIGRITTRTEGGVLRLGMIGSYRTHFIPTVRLTVPAIERIDLQTSGNARILGLRGGRLRLTSNGSGRFIADGWVEHVSAAFSGSGGAELADLRAEDVEIVIDGSGRAAVNVTRRLTATLNGSGQVIYSGNPESVETQVNGSGSISPAGRGS
jgi:hypothetical protein